MNKYYVYFHKRKTDGSIFYIGKGCRSRCSAKTGRNKYWNNIVKKHGLIIEVPFKNLTNEQSCNLEIDLIRIFRIYGMCEANLADGGQGGGHGLKPWNYGKKHTKEHAYKSGRAFRGKKRPEHSKFMKELCDKRGMPWKGKVPHNAKLIICTNNGKVYPTARHAAEDLKVLRQSILKVCKGILSHTGGYNFKYYREAQNQSTKC